MPGGRHAHPAQVPRTEEGGRVMTPATRDQLVAQLRRILPLARQLKGRWMANNEVCARVEDTVNWASNLLPGEFSDLYEEAQQVVEAMSDIDDTLSPDSLPAELSAYITSMADRL